MFCRTWHRCVFLLVLLFLAVSVFLPATAFADAQPDLSQPCSLTLTVKDPATGAVLPEVGFTLYRVASAAYGSGTLRYAYTEAFERNGVPLDLSAEGFAEHLAAFAGAHAIAGDVRAAEADGSVRFSELSSGLYLAVQHHGAAGYYAVRPFLVTLPLQTADGWSYHVDAEPKTAPVPALPQTMRLAVQKCWDDADAADRPKSVAVMLCCDGMPAETVLLTEENGWSYVWETLDASHVWSVAEVDAAQGYTVRYETDVQSVTIINTKHPQPSPTPKPPLVQTGFRSRGILLTVSMGVCLLLCGAWITLSKRSS